VLGVVVESRRRRAIVILKNFRCRWGKCVFCPFHLESGTEVSDVLETNAKILELLEKAVHSFDIEWISIFNGGSFFELPLDVVLRLARFTRNRVVDIETRPEYISTESILALLHILQPRILRVRIGFEVWDEKIRNGVLRKGIPQSEVYRVAEVRRQLRYVLGDSVRFLVYVLFGIEGVDEEEVKCSVIRFSELFDGVIAVKYRKVLPHHPREVSVSSDLLSFLRERCMDVDVDEDREWSFGNGIKYVVY